MGKKNVLVKVALVFALVVMGSMAAQAQIKIKDIEPKALRAPDVVGQVQIVKPRRKSKNDEWLAYIVDYQSSKLRDVKFVWSGYAKAKEPGKIYQFRKEVEYSLVPAGENYAAIFIDPESVKAYYGDISAKKVSDIIQLRLYISYKGKKIAGPYYIKGSKVSTRGDDRPYKESKNGQMVDFFQNKKESPFATSQVGQFNTIK